MVMFDETPLLTILRGIPTRELAIEAASRYLVTQGWFLVEKEGIDLVAIHPRGSRLLLKFWVNPRKTPVPKFYVKNFDRVAQAFITSSGFKENVDVVLVSNAILDRDAHTYYTAVARFTLRVGFSAGDIKEQLERLRSETAAPKELAQRHLLQYLSTA